MPALTTAGPDRVALVTGASRGIGLCTVEALLGRGYSVHAWSRDVVTVLPEAGARLQRRAIDLRHFAAIADGFADVGVLDLLVLNAGVCPVAPLRDSMESMQESMAVNFWAPYHCILAALPKLRSGGRIVAIASGLGKLGRAGYAGYCAAKHALLGLCKCAAQELAGQGITVNVVCPGWVDTDMARLDIAGRSEAQGRDSEALRSEVLRQIPIGRMVQPEEVAELVCFLASPAAAAITGEAYNISGGEFFA